MGVKLQKKLKEENLYFIVYNSDKKTYNDWFMFDEYKELPILEKYFFNLMASELNDLFENKDYSSSKYKASLLLLYNLCFDGEKLNLKCTNLLSELYINIRYRDLSQKIEAMRNKISRESIERNRASILNTKLSELSKETIQLFNQVKSKVKEQNSDEILREIIFLSLKTEYEQAIKRAKKLEDMVEFGKNLCKSEGKRFEDIADIR